MWQLVGQFTNQHYLHSGHCKALAPEYEEAATTLKEKNIALAKIDCTEEADLCQSYGVEGYPTIKVFRGEDNVTPYTGQRKAQAIVSYMVKQSLPAVSTISTENIEEFKTADKVVLVAYFAADDKASNETFTSIADIHRDSYLFGASSDAALAKAEGVSQPAIVLYKSFDEGKNTFTEKFDKEHIETFVKTASVPLVGEVGPETYAGYMAVSHNQDLTSTHMLIKFSRPEFHWPTYLPRPQRSAPSSLRSLRIWLHCTRASSASLPLTLRLSVLTLET
jgi:protein disulfide isomerase